MLSRLQLEAPTLATSLAVCVIITFLGTALYQTAASALPTGTPTLSLMLTFFAALAIFLGILSSLLFDRLDKRLPRATTMRKGDMMIASAISPLVFLAVYPLLKETQDPVIQTLLAYQNGFAFQNVVTRVRSTP